jgi:hypothetical protein
MTSATAITSATVATVAAAPTAAQTAGPAAVAAVAAVGAFARCFHELMLDADLESDDRLATDSEMAKSRSVYALLLVLSKGVADHSATSDDDWKTVIVKMKEWLNRPADRYPKLITTKINSLTDNEKLVAAKVYKAWMTKISMT